MFDKIHIVMLTLMVAELLFTIIKISLERKKREKERSYAEFAIEQWKESTQKAIIEIRSIGDNFQDRKTMDNNLMKLRSLTDELNTTLYSLSLLSTNNPLEMEKSLSYFIDRDDQVDRVLISFFRLKLKEYKGEEFRIIEKKSDEILES